jgi:queuine tRNA-ribosyltransferase/7-cyano-7-deazaguanine tRNA-ribosyltransferase
MVNLEILKRSKKSKARLGILRTPHGIVETPSLVPVATQAVVKTLTSREAKEAGCQILISNTFHLHLKPGEKILKSAGGIHSFMQWDRPLMTDSGGFQVFSLGFGHDLSVGKVLKYFPEKKNKHLVETGSQPQKVKITEDGVFFRSPVDGKQLYIGPKESMKIQESIGADMIFAFDECTPPLASKAYAKDALQRTHRWAKICLETKKSKQALLGIIQGSHFKDLRFESAKFMASLDFDGFGIGGDLGSSKDDIKKILRWTVPFLPEKKPRHLLGIGYLEDMEAIIKEGIDLFDCTVPTHYARHGSAFTRGGKIDMKRTSMLKEKGPLDKKCSCMVCQNYSRSYIAHLVRAKEMTGVKLLTFHNLYYFNEFVADIRRRIKEGKI